LAPGTLEKRRDAARAKDEKNGISLWHRWYAAIGFRLEELGYDEKWYRTLALYFQNAAREFHAQTLAELSQRWLGTSNTAELVVRPFVAPKDEKLSCFRMEAVRVGDSFYLDGMKSTARRPSNTLVLSTLPRSIAEFFGEFVENMGYRLKPK